MWIEEGKTKILNTAGNIPNKKSQTFSNERHKGSITDNMALDTRMTAVGTHTRLIKDKG